MRNAWRPPRVLSVLGGFLDMYTYLCRGKVFINAITGNMVLFGLNLANLEWTARESRLPSAEK